jgi:hypothetical protein
MKKPIRILGEFKQYQSSSPVGEFKQYQCSLLLADLQSSI